MSEETLVLPTAHPDAAVLAAFARGKLSSTELAAVAEHVAACDECCAALRNVPDDTLVSLARQAGETPSDQASIPAALAPFAKGTPTVATQTPPPAPAVAESAFDTE